MSPFRTCCSKLALLSLLGFLEPKVVAQSNPCITFGIDFQDGASYFQNLGSNDPFTFVQEFEGCQNDTSQNMLVDPIGNQYACTNTPLLPSDTPENSTCSITKNELSSGLWSIVVMSNNGAADPIAYERDFSLVAGQQQTITSTPTIVIQTTVTPIVNSTVLTTDTISKTLPAVTTTVPSTTLHATKTVTPSRVTSTTTKVLYTITRVHPTISIVKTTKTVRATCTIPSKPDHYDREAKIIPTLQGYTAQALSGSPTPTKRPAVRVMVRDLLRNREEFIRERRDRYSDMNGNLVRRAPDQPTVTVVNPNTADYPTITSTETAPTVTLLVTSTVDTTTTITPPVVTVMSGKTVQVVTVTAPTPTRVLTKYTLAYVTTTKAFKYTVTFTSTVTPAASVTACRANGGFIL